MFFKFLILAFLKKIFAIFANLIKFFESLNLSFFHQGPRDLVQCLMISCRITSKIIGMAINILMTLALAIFFGSL